jgi:hypothetical protein
MPTVLYYEGCNHSLTRKEISINDEIVSLFGNASFDWREAGFQKHSIERLLEQDFLRTASGDKVFHRGKVVIGRPPYRRVS